MSSLKSATLSTLTRLILVAFVNAASILLVANILGPKNNAQYTIAITVGHGISQILNLGIGTSIVYFVKSGEITARQSTKLVILCCAFLSVFSFLVTFSLGSFYLPLFFPGVPKTVLLAGASCAPLILTHNIISSVFLATEKFILFNALSTAPTIFNFLLLGSFLLVENPSVDFLISLTMTAFSFSCILLVLTCLKTFGFERIKYKKDFSRIFAFAKFGFPVLLANLIAFLNYKADLGIVNYVLGTESAGVYAIAVFLSESLGYISSAIAMSVLPKMIGESSNQDRNTVRNAVIFRQTFYMSLTAGVLIWCFFAAGTYWLMPLYYQSVVPAAVLMLGTVIISPFRILSAEIVAIGKPSINALSSFGGLCITVLASSWLSQEIGLLGAATGSMLGYWSLAAILFCCHRKVFNTPWSILAINPISDLRLMIFFLKNSIIK